MFGNTFEPNLSIIDLLFSKGPDSLEILRKSASN
ncbi:MAG: WbqC family protein [Cytophagaceae bacterium]|nr:WbqC family protein [Cytophagaceae bacterium]